MNELPLTRSQALIWLGQKLHPDAPLYNMAFAFTLDGAIDPDRFQLAWQWTVDQTDALRMSITERNGEAFQRISDAAEAHLDVLDFSSEPDACAAYRAWLTAYVRKGFAHDQRLYACAIAKLGEGRYAWVLNQHHIAQDAWSSQLIYQRMAWAYASGDFAAARPLPAFAEYAALERSEDTTARFATGRAHFDHRASEVADALAGPASDRARRGTRTTRVSIDLGPARTDQLRRVAARPGFRALSADASALNLLATALVAYLHRDLGAERVRMAMPFHNRPTPALKDTAGLLIEVLPLLFDVREGDTFATLHGRVSREVTTALRHVQPGLCTSDYNRVCEVLLNFIHFRFPDFAGMRPRIEWVHPGHGDVTNGLRVQAHDFEGTGSLTLDFDFNDSDYAEQDRAATLRRFVAVLDGMLAKPDARLDDVSLIAAEEHASLVSEFNRTDAPFPSDATVVDLFLEQARHSPDAIAVECDGRTLTYGQLARNARDIAAGLRAEGVGPGHAVIVRMPHGVDVVAATLGVLMAGAAYVPVDATHPLQRVRSIADDIERSLGRGTPLVLCEPSTDGELASVGMKRWVPHAGADGDVLQTRSVDLAYILYTSGSTGAPKGVMIEHRSLTNYLWWAADQYTRWQPRAWAFFSSLSFDLTVTSLFAPLITGGRLLAYPEPPSGHGTGILRVVSDGRAEVVKCTPSHLALIADANLAATRIRTFVVGGENFQTGIARAIHAGMAGQGEIFNEYGPTEATVGCMIHRFDPVVDSQAAVPIGTPAANARIYVLDRALNPVPPGVIGEIHIGGLGLARGYLGRDDLTHERFIDLRDPKWQSRAPVLALVAEGTNRLYRTGDLARWRPDGRLEFLGRRDHQVKIGGARVEPAEIEAALISHPEVASCVVDARPFRMPNATTLTRACTRCGLASDFPGVTFDERGVCNFCASFDRYRAKTAAYFRSMSDFATLAAEIRRARRSEHDCIVLFSGGKDSTYMLYQVVAAGLTPLAFTLDNGFLSDQAKTNISRVCQSLGVRHHWGSTPAMNAIFADSLRRHANVCNGCFKTIYTLASMLARERGIGYIVTGLSRGQFFETRLSEAVFTMPGVTPDAIDAAVLSARKAYHRQDDAVSRSLDADMFRDDSTFSDVTFVDFYRYCDASLEEMYAFLDANAPWIRPSDTGRSTNCLINDVGIWVHKRRRGYHNYALPYSWDVRLGHKTREAALAELNDDIDEARVRSILDRIGYDDPLPSAEPGRLQLVAYVTGPAPIAPARLRAHLAERLPDAMVPAHYVQLDHLPLTRNGKVDRAALPDPGTSRPSIASAFVAPRTQLEQAVAELWRDALRLDRIGVLDDFFEIGGTSLPALQILSRVNARYQVRIEVDAFFASPTVESLAGLVEAAVLADLERLTDEEAAALAHGS